MKLPQLTFTRFIAAIAIVIFHDRGLSFPFYYNAPQLFVPFLNCLVSYFFVLSGFILIVSSHKDGKLNLEKKTFWFNRFSRIYPLYLFALIFYLVICLSAKTPNTTLTPDQFLLTASLSQAWLPHYVMTYNYPAWSLSVEAFFYLMFPLLVYLFDKMRFKMILVTGFMIWITTLTAFIYTININVTPNFTFYFPLLHFNEFVVGICVGYTLLYKNEYLYKNRNYIYFLLFITGIAAIMFIGFKNVFFGKYYHDGLLAPLFSLFILSLAISKGKISKLFCNRYAIYLGEISYGIYILQIPFKLLIVGINNRTLHLSHTAEFYVYVVGLVIFCAICFELIEKPTRIWLRKNAWYRISLEST